MYAALNHGFSHLSARFDCSSYQQKFDQEMKKVINMNQDIKFIITEVDCRCVNFNHGCPKGAAPVWGTATVPGIFIRVKNKLRPTRARGKESVWLQCHGHYGNRNNSVYTLYRQSVGDYERSDFLRVKPCPLHGHERT